MIYIATFYSHFGAVRYNKLCKNKGMVSKLMPVPRDLSSSCGTCVRYEGELLISDDSFIDEIEKIVKVSDNGYEQVYGV